MSYTEFSPGHVPDMDVVGRLCEWLPGRMADITSHFHQRDFPLAVVRALSSEMNVYLAILGHLRLDGWTSIPAADPFTLLLKRALEDEDVALLKELPQKAAFPPTAGQVSPLSEDVFPKWWLDPAVLSPEWASFDLGEHICLYHADILHRTVAAASAQEAASHSARPDSSPGGPRTSAEFQQEVNRIQTQLSAAEVEVSTALRGLQDIWEQDLKLYQETDSQWQEIHSPKPGQEGLD